MRPLKGSAGAGKLPVPSRPDTAPGSPVRRTRVQFHLYFQPDRRQSARPRPAGVVAAIVAGQQRQQRPYRCQQGPIQVGQPQPESAGPILGGIARLAWNGCCRLGQEDFDAPGRGAHQGSAAFERPGLPQAGARLATRAGMERQQRPQEGRAHADGVGPLRARGAGGLQ